MDVVKRCACAVLLAAACALPAHACGVVQWQPQIDEASRRYAMPEAWIRAVLRAESNGCTHLHGQPITSHAGAMGLMQIMPGTWAELRQRHGFGTDPHDPRENILAATAYLREMTDRFGVPGAFAAYHAGPGRYEAHLRHGAPLQTETRRYLAQVSAAVGIGDAAPVAEHFTEPREDALFAVVRNRRVLNAREPHHADPRLFVPLRYAHDIDAEPPSPPPESSHVEP